MLQCSVPASIQNQNQDLFSRPSMLVQDDFVAAVDERAEADEGYGHDSDGILGVNATFSHFQHRLGRAEEPRTSLAILGWTRCATDAA